MVLPTQKTTNPYRYANIPQCPSPPCVNAAVQSTQVRQSPSTTIRPGYNVVPQVPNLIPCPGKAIIMSSIYRYEYPSLPTSRTSSQHSPQHMVNTGAQSIPTNEKVSSSTSGGDPPTPRSQMTGMRQGP